MTTEQELRDKLRKISALFEGATTTGEREAAAAAIDRLRKVLAAAEQVEPSTEMQFTNLDRWHRKLFLALCRRYGLRYNTGSLFRQYLTVMKRILVNTLPPRAVAASAA